MISLLTIKQSNEIKELLQKDNIFVNVLGLDSIDEWEPDTTNTLWFSIHRDKKEIGIMLIQPFSTNALCFHGGVFKSERSNNSAETLKNCLYLLRQEDDFVYVTTVAEGNHPAISLLKKAGFIQKAVIKNGCKTDNLILFGET